MELLVCDRCGADSDFSPDATYPRRCEGCGCVVRAASAPWIDLAAAWARARVPVVERARASRRDAPRA